MFGRKSAADRAAEAQAAAERRETLNKAKADARREEARQRRLEAQAARRRASRW